MVRLLTYRRKDYLVLYVLRGVRDYFHGYMVPSTGYLATSRSIPTRPASSCASRRGPARSSSRWSPIPS